MLNEVIQTIPQVLIDGLALGTVYAVIALGYTMVYGILKLINFAHGNCMTGAFIGTALLIFMTGTGWGSALPAIVMLIIVLIITASLTGFLGMGIERLAYRPLRNAPRLILAYYSYRYFIFITRYCEIHSRINKRELYCNGT